VKSIRTFLTVVILATITLMVFLSELQGFRLNLAAAEKLFDKQLADTAHLLSATYSPVTDNNPQITETEFFGFQIWIDDQLKLRSSRMPDELIANLEQGYQEHNFGKHRWRTYSYFDELKNVWILTAQRTDVRYTLAENIVIKSILPALIILPLGGLLIWTIVGYGVSPLQRLSDQLRRKQADDFSPLPIEKQPVELTQVVKSTNDLLSRLKASFQREKHFSADAAHELRTPISVLKVHLHNLNKKFPADDRNFQQVVTATERMGHLIEQILLLNRTSPDQFITKFISIDLYKLAQEVIAREYPQFEKKDLKIELNGEHCLIEGDQFALETMLKNLLENACKYTPDDGNILVSVKAEMQADENASQKVVKLEIQDSGPGVPEDQYGRLFDRFYRLDGDRHASGTTGSGLGLAIVRHIADLHKATIKLTKSSFDSGLSVTVIFPFYHANPLQVKKHHV